MIRSQIITLDPTPWFRSEDARGITISAAGDFVGGLFRFQKLLNGTTTPIRSPDGQPVFYASDFDELFAFRSGYVFRFNLTGTTGTPSIVFQITGEVTEPNPLLL